MLSRRKTGAFLSGLIYEDWDEVREGLDRIGFELIGEPFDVAGSQGMLVMNKRPGNSPEAWLIFRGTSLNLSDWWSNVGWPVEWDGPGKIHSGYRRHFSYIRDPIRELAEKIPSPIPLYIAGHSLGGTQATAYASWINSGLPTDHKIMGLYTYGSPKVLNSVGVDAIIFSIDRVVNFLDPAPIHPMIPGLTHTRGKHRINSGGWPIPWRRHSVEQYIRTVR